MNNDRDRLVKIAAAFAIAFLVSLIALVSVGSYEIAKINQSIAELAAKKPTEIDYKRISQQVASLIELPTPENGKDGANGRNGRNGKDGLDSVSTNTVIERQTNTIVEKELPPQDGKNGSDGQPIVIAIDASGKLYWKYADDREWMAVPIIEAQQ